MTLDQLILEQWMAGDEVLGVGFSLYEPVLITAARWQGPSAQLSLSSR